MWKKPAKACPKATEGTLGVFPENHARMGFDRF